MAEQKVATEVAQAEFERFAEAMDLDTDVDRMDEDDKTAFTNQKRRVVRAIEDGHLVVDDKGQPVYTPQLGDQTPITFYEPTGVSLMSMDKKKANENVAKVFATLADMTKTSSQRFASMKGRDVKLCQALYLLFLG